MNYVPPEINCSGPGNVLIVVRDPGEKEVEKGQPLVGASGKLLFGGYYFRGPDAPPQNRFVWRSGLMQHAGWQRSDFNIANLVPRKPWNNEFFRHSWDSINSGTAELDQLIRELQPKLIIAMGNEASFHLVPGWSTIGMKPGSPYPGGKTLKSAKGIVERRGFFWLRSDGAWVMPTLHPANCLYQPVPNTMLLARDLERARMWMDGELERVEFPVPVEIHCEADMKPIWECGGTVEFDIETLEGGTAMRCIAFGLPDGQTFVSYRIDHCRSWLMSNKPKRAHNMMFDLYILRNFIMCPVGGLVEDTIILHWAMYPELAGKKESGREDDKKANKLTRKSLAFLASWYLNVPWWKEYTDNREHMGQLCSNDVYATGRCWQIMEPIAQQMKIMKQYARHRDMVPMLLKMQQRGMLVDEGLRLERMTAIGARSSLLKRESEKAALDAAEREGWDEFLVEKKWVCSCCNGGVIKRGACASCAGLKNTKRPTLRELAESRGISHEGVSVAGLKDLLLGPCAACGGDGKRVTYVWDFNVMSGEQLGKLLYDCVGIPKYVVKDRNAQEDTIKDIYRWATT